MTSEIYKNLWTDCIDANFKCCLFEKANLQKLISEQDELTTMISKSIDANLSSDEQLALEISGFELIDQIKLDNAKLVPLVGRVHCEYTEPNSMLKKAKQMNVVLLFEFIFLFFNLINCEVPGI